MTAPYYLTATEIALAEKFIKEAQDALGLAIARLREYYALTHDDSAFRIIHELEARHSRTYTCLDVAFNLDDLRKYMRPPKEPANA